MINALIIHPNIYSNNENTKHDTQILYVQMMQQIVSIYFGTLDMVIITESQVSKSMY